jgi:hypothetical protein
MAVVAVVTVVTSVVTAGVTAGVTVMNPIDNECPDHHKNQAAKPCFESLCNTI